MVYFVVGKEDPWKECQQHNLNKTELATERSASSHFWNLVSCITKKKKRNLHWIDRRHIQVHVSLTTPNHTHAHAYEVRYACFADHSHAPGSATFTASTARDHLPKCDHGTTCFCDKQQLTRGLSTVCVAVYRCKCRGLFLILPRSCCFHQGSFHPHMYTMCVSRNSNNRLSTIIKSTLIDWLIDCLTDCYTHLIDWLTGGWMDGWILDWLIGLIDWKRVIDWAIGTVYRMKYCLAISE